MIIQLPIKKGQPNTSPQIEFQQMVIVGANGSGKTRFGSWIEQHYLKQTHRISAQKSLTFPKSVSPTSKNKAQKELYYGHSGETWDESTLLNQKINTRWGGNFNTNFLNDYEKLMTLLHTEEYEDALSYKEGRIEKPITKLDDVQKIWEAILPHRKLFKRAGVIETYPTGQEHSKYNASEMSDGERVIFYLIGEVICSPRNSIMIIDEPEMHIHRSLVKKLFDLIEIERPDCSFIYLTHDIDFAFSRRNAVKIWTKSYEGNNIWDYEFLNNSSPIPEQLYLEILGSRKSVIFLEGDSSSIDYLIYEQIYPDFTIKPLGSCEKVIQSVKSLNEQNNFHHLQSFGIIDRDRRQAVDISNLISKNVWVLDVAEAESLLLLENIVRAVANHMGKSQDDVFNTVKTNVIQFFNEQFESQIILHFKEVLKRKLLEITNFTSKNLSDAISEIDNHYSSINKQQLFDEIKLQFENIIRIGDYEGILRMFNLKNALIPNSKVCELTGIKNKEEYLKLVLNLLKKNDQISGSIKSEIKRKILK